MSDTSGGQTTAKVGRGVFTLIIVVVVLLLLGLLWYLCRLFAGTGAEGSGGGGPGVSFALPVLAITGVVILLVALGVMAVAFGFFGLTEAKNALALPEGSVRAVVALSLVVLFAILSIFLYEGLSTPGVVELAKDVNKDRMNEIVASIGNVSVQKTGDNYTITRGATPNAAAQDFAKQLLVMIGTLVTAVASFYFGGQIAASAHSAGATAVATAPGTNPPRDPTGQTGQSGQTGQTGQTGQSGQTGQTGVR